MILSVSRRTDIPNYYADWFYNRIKERFLYVKNPMNPHQVSRIALSPELVDCIVFWTKNPEPMLAKLHELDDYAYYFQFTLTGYGRDIEPNVPHKKNRMIPVFQKLSGTIGSSRIIWRYDPILFNNIYTPEYHLRAFEQIADALAGYTKKCIISFVDTYAKNRTAMKALGVWELALADGREDSVSYNNIKIFASKLSEIAHRYGMEIATCAEKLDLSDCGIAHSSCIDRALVEEIAGYSIDVSKDKNQRAECGCVESVEVGTYHTCLNGCKYCYANDSWEKAERNFKAYDADSPLLCGQIEVGDRITERKVKRLENESLNF